MNVLLFGATGMVGQSVLRECLLDPLVAKVTGVGRSITGQQHAKLHEIKHIDLLDLSAIEDQLTGFDACFFCLGISSAGMSEARYTAITYDLTLSIAKVLARLNPQMTFIYVTGSGTDSTERGRSMWARVKGKTENDLLKLPFKAAYMFRPGAILPKNGVRSKTKLYQAIYDVMRPFFPLLERGFKNSVTTSDKLGRAMIKVARQGYHTPLIESSDINKLG
ncbi:NAD-dependent epimerase/dehydratase family protein [Paenibacillus montanisoli]|uniref:Epimerase n=1 Tax=Paenibacillus montanisoli TaxID=2081970 RepID=A0A328UCN3_9BACL|nr:NAD-dependent epimerase/dehydratase family protein [Paenibacillus montanisoli]RAP77796.1 epimerase [Paenibacillus montanisoli]